MKNFYFLNRNNYYGLDKERFYALMDYETDGITKARNKEIFLLRYSGDEVITYGVIAEKFNISRERVRQICISVAKGRNKYVNKQNR